MKENIDLKYYKYRKNRKKIIFKKINNDLTFDENKKSKIAIIIPYRKRFKHIIEFIKNIINENFDIYIVEQNDNKKFNKGVLYNFGFLIASSKKNYDFYIFNDVDSLPDKNLIKQYYYDKKNGDNIIHYASPYLDYKYQYPDFFGGCIGISKDLYIKINGFPNNFYGWGGEDDSFYNRIALLNKEVYRPNIGSFILLEHDPPKKEELNIIKKKNILDDLKNWNKNGLNNNDKFYKINDNFKIKIKNLNIEFYSLKIIDESNYLKKNIN
jgi:hypothetical protein